MATSLVGIWKHAKEKAEKERKAAGGSETKPEGRTKIEGHLKEIESMISSKKDPDKINAKIVQLRADMAMYKSALPATERTLLKALDQLSPMLKDLEKSIVALPGLSRQLAASGVYTAKNIEKYKALALEQSKLNTLLTAVAAKRDSLETKIQPLRADDPELAKNIAKLTDVLKEFGKLQEAYNKVFVKMGDLSSHGKMDK